MTVHALVQNQLTQAENMDAEKAKGKATCFIVTTWRTLENKSNFVRHAVVGWVFASCAGELGRNVDRSLALL